MHRKNHTITVAAMAAVLSTTNLVADDGSAPVVPHGVIENSGWALARLNDGDSPTDPAACSYRFPETTRPVRLYLIDAPIDNTSGWFDENPNLTIGNALRFLGGGQAPESYDPSTTTTSNHHGNRVLSVIAGPELGAARGTPIEVHSYDIYSADPEGGPSNLGLLLGALGSAIIDFETDKEFDDPDLLGVVCITNGTGEPARSPALLSMIDQAIGVGLVVVVSAGNENADVLNGNTIDEILNGTADAYLPGAYGSAREGLIAVGASTSENSKSPISNYGEGIDLYAPGVDVMALDPSAPSAGQTSPMSGTSPAAALVAAAAIAEISRQPDLDPAGVEQALKDRLYDGEVSIVQIDDDLDGDGVVDELERFFGYSISDPESTPPSPHFSVGESTTALSFTIAASLWQPEDPMNLADSSAWRLMGSTDLVNWFEVSTFLSVGEETDGRVPVTVVTPRESSLEDQMVHEGDGAAWVATEEQMQASQEALSELFETQREMFPEWYWEILGFDDESIEEQIETTSAVVSPSISSGIFYRIEVIPHP